MKWTCSTCGRITDQRQCPEHQTHKRPSSEQQRFRDAVLRRDGYRCRRCGATDVELRAAHWPIPLRAYAKDDPRAYHPASGMALCLDCDRKLDPYAR